MGFFAAHSAAARGPLAYLAALKVTLWDYSSVTMFLQVWSDIPVYTTVAAATAFLGSNVVRNAFPQLCTKTRCVLPAVNVSGIGLEVRNEFWTLQYHFFKRNTALFFAGWVHECEPTLVRCHAWNFCTTYRHFRLRLRSTLKGKTPRTLVGLSLKAPWIILQGFGDSPLKIINIYFKF